MNNYFISYDLNVPGKDYSKAIEAIQAVGNWARVHKSFWYVSSALSLEQVYAQIAYAFDGSDQFMVVHANGARWNTLPSEVSDFMLKNWNL